MGTDGDRKSRLAALAARAGRTKAPLPSEGDHNDADDNNNNNQQKKSISFRNYAPTDKSLEQQGTSEDNDEKDVPPSKRPRTEDRDPAAAATEFAAATPVSSKSMLQDALREAQRDTQRGTAPLDATAVVNMAPKKINWDLKRDIQPKLAKLEKRTQKAIVEMLKKRLELEASQAADDDDDDDDDDGDLD
jgi:coiled-coil domain-containing protein 12